MVTVPPEGWEPDIQWTKDVVPDVQGVVFLQGLQVIQLQQTAQAVVPTISRAQVEHDRLDARIDEVATSVASLAQVVAALSEQYAALTSRVAELEKKPK